jgi:hypothetical protein
MVSLAPVTAATDKISEQYRRARPSECKTSDAIRAWFWRLLDCPTNAGRLRGVGHDQERQVRSIGGNDIRAQATFIATLFNIAAERRVNSPRRPLSSGPKLNLATEPPRTHPCRHNHSRDEPDGRRSTAPSRKLWTALRTPNNDLTCQSDWLVNYAERHRSGGVLARYGPKLPPTSW